MRIELGLRMPACSAIAVDCCQPDRPARSTEPSLQGQEHVRRKRACELSCPSLGSTRANIASRTVLTAEFQPFQEVDVMAKVAGYVRSIKVDLGDRVREGQVLAELEIPEMTDEVSKAAAVVEQTRRKSRPHGMNCSARNRRTRSHTFLTRGCRKCRSRSRV